MSWQKISLKDINTCKLETINPQEFPDEAFEYYSIPDYQNNQRPSITYGRDIQSSKYLLKPGSTLFGKLNPRVEKVWKVAEPSGLRQIGSTEWISITPDSRVDLDFLYFLQWSDFVMPLAKKLVSGSTPSRQRVDPTSFYQIEVPLPDLEEQRRIGSTLSTIKAGIDAQEKIIATTTELKKALMQKLFTEGLRGEKRKMTEVGLVPESWEVVTVGEIVQVKGGKRLPKGERLATEDTGLPYIRVTDLADYSVDTSDLRFLNKETQARISRYIINTTDVYISIAGSIGICGMIPEGLDGANLTENAARLITIDSSTLYPRYLMYWLSSEYSQSSIKAQTLKNAQPKLALARIKSLLIALPPLKHQHDIADTLDTLRRRISIAENQKHILQSLFQTMLHNLMTGTTRIENVDRIPALSI